MIYTKQEWYTPAEVAVHNKATDCWVSLNGKVRNLTSWLEQQFRVCKCTKSCTCEVKSWYCDNDCVETCPCFRRGFLYCDGKRLAMTIFAYAGKDVSHWFQGDEWIRYIHPIVGSCVLYMPYGPGPRQPIVPSTKWRPFSNPWWLDESLVVGFTVTLEVCSEETIYQIMMRYLPHNSHMMSYTWRYLGRGLCCNKTLAENGIPDERDLFNDLALPENVHIPAILLYYDDDLTEDPPMYILRNTEGDKYCNCRDQQCKHKLELCRQ